MEQIRFGTNQDIHAVLSLYHQLHPNEDTIVTEKRKAAFEEIIADKNHYFTVVERENQIIATAHLMIMPNLSRGGASSAYVENVVVDAAYRNQQVGERLFDFLFQTAEEQGCYKIFLCTGTLHNETLGKDTEKRHRFYKKVGFQDGIKHGFIHYFKEDL